MMGGGNAEKLCKMRGTTGHKPVVQFTLGVGVCAIHTGGGGIPAKHEVRSVCVRLSRARMVVLKPHDCLERRGDVRDVSLVLDHVSRGRHHHLDVLHPLAAAEKCSDV